MTVNARVRSSRWSVAVGALVMGLAGCKPGDILDVPPPSNVFSSTAVQGQSSAEDVLNGGQSLLFNTLSGLQGLTTMTGLLTDEFTNTQGSDCCQNTIDARYTTSLEGGYEFGDGLVQQLLWARSQFLLAVPPLQQYEVGAGRARIGEAFALMGYAELLMAEDYCAGVPLSHAVFGGGVVYGKPMSTDSLLGTAEAHFDSALAYASGSDTIQMLASVGLGRTLLNRGRYDSAAIAVAGVTTSFVYSTEMGTVGSPYGQNLYSNTTAYSSTPCSFFNVSDREGGNGLNFVSAADPRLVLDSTLIETCDGVAYGLPDSVYYYPVKFGSPSVYVPMASGVEARLIEAEAALQAQQVGTWAADLRTLRADSVDTHMPFPAADSLPSDSAEAASSDAQVSLMFRERAFWLFGTGSRLGDMRRLIRQYNRGSETVFPTGPYDPALQGNPVWASHALPVPSYGGDVNITLPTTQTNGLGGSPTTNPYYKGCTSPTTTA